MHGLRGNVLFSTDRPYRHPSVSANRRLGHVAFVQSNLLLKTWTFFSRSSARPRSCFVSLRLRCLLGWQIVATRTPTGLRPIDRSLQQSAQCDCDCGKITVLANGRWTRRRSLRQVFWLWLWLWHRLLRVSTYPISTPVQASSHRTPQPPCLVSTDLPLAPSGAGHRTTGNKLGSPDGRLGGWQAASPSCFEAISSI